jgi:translocator protein
MQGEGLRQDRDSAKGLAPDAGLFHSSGMTKLFWRHLALSTLPVIATSLAGNAVTMPKIGGWYAAIVKPSFNPPNWLFAPVWTLLFILMGYAVYRIWRLDAQIPGRPVALLAFYAQLVLNFGWSAAFFGMESPLLGLAVIVPFLGLILTTIILFRPLDRTASLLLWPYAAWVSFATVLNVSLWWLNR